MIIFTRLKRSRVLVFLINPIVLQLGRYRRRPHCLSSLRKKVKKMYYLHTCVGRLVIKIKNMTAFYPSLEKTPCFFFRRVSKDVCSSVMMFIIEKQLKTCTGFR